MFLHYLNSSAEGWVLLCLAQHCHRMKIHFWMRKLILATTEHQAWIMLFTLNYICVIFMNIFSVFSDSSSKLCWQSWKKPTSEWNLWCDTMEATGKLRVLSLPIGCPSLLVMRGLSLKCYFETWEIHSNFQYNTI